jgi:cyclopropane fatty-acyl-phospholipid synthase-like methyltransferase
MRSQWTPEKLDDLSGDFQVCRILLTAAELDLFTKLKKEPQSLDELCLQENWNKRALRMILDALVSIRFISKTSDGFYGADKQIAAMLGQGGENSILPLVLHRGRMWRTWSHLTEIVQTGENPNFKNWKPPSTAELEAFIGAMHIEGRKVAEDIVKSVDLRFSNHLLDLGGGSGTYTLAFLKAAHHMTATLFDKPHVVNLAKKYISESGYSDRVRFVAGDYTTDELPAGHDLVLISAIIHAHARGLNQDLFLRTYESLEPGGMILIRDYFMDDSRISPSEGAIFAVNLLASTRSGESYTLEEVRHDLEGAGFKNVHMIRDGQHMDQLVAGIK